jgi:hypothetical protein
MYTVHSPKDMHSFKTILEKSAHPYISGSIRWEPVEEWHGEIGVVEQDAMKVYFMISSYKDTYKLTVSFYDEKHPVNCISESKLMSESTLPIETPKFLERVLSFSRASTPVSPAAT